MNINNNNCYKEIDLESYFWDNQKEARFPEIHRHLNHCKSCLAKYEQIKKENSYLENSTLSQKQIQSGLNIVRPVSEWNNVIDLKREFSPFSKHEKRQLKAAASNTVREIEQVDEFWSKDRKLIGKIFYNYLDLTMNIYLVNSDPGTTQFIPFTFHPVADFLISDYDSSAAVKTPKPEISPDAKIMLACPLAAFVINRKDIDDKESKAFKDSNDNNINISYDNAKAAGKIDLSSFNQPDLKVVFGDRKGAIRFQPAENNIVLFDYNNLADPYYVKIYS